MSVRLEQIACDAFAGVVDHERAYLLVQVRSRPGGEQHCEIEIVHVRSGYRDDAAGPSRSWRKTVMKASLQSGVSNSARINALSQRPATNITDSAKPGQGTPLTERLTRASANRDVT